MTEDFDDAIFKDPPPPSPPDSLAKTITDSMKEMMSVIARPLHIDVFPGHEYEATIFWLEHSSVDSEINAKFREGWRIQMMHGFEKALFIVFIRDLPKTNFENPKQ